MSYFGSRFRGRGRGGFRSDTTVSLRGEGDRFSRFSQAPRTPLQRAQDDLGRALDPYNVSSERRDIILSEASRIDTLPVMNMPILAAAMLYLRDYPDPTPDTFTDEQLQPYLDQLMIDYTMPTPGTSASRDQDQVRLRYKQAILRYILKVFAGSSHGSDSIIDDAASS